MKKKYGIGFKKDQSLGEMTPITLENFDKLIDDKQSDKYIQKHFLFPKHPARILIVGGSGSGKTNLLLNILLNGLLHYNRIYIYAKDLLEDKYQALKGFYAKMEADIEEKLGESVTVATFSDKVEDIVDIDDINTELQNVIVFDDFITVKDQSMISNLFVRGRKKNTTIIYLTQSYFAVPKMIRLNSTDFMIFSVNSKRELLQLQMDHAQKVDKDMFVKIFREATAEPFQFLMIDTRTQHMPMHLRQGFNGLYVPSD